MNLGPDEDNFTEINPDMAIPIGAARVSIQLLILCVGPPSSVCWRN